MAPNHFDTLSPLEKALVETLQGMHRDVIKELRIFRWHFLALVVFLIGLVALSKGIDPRIAAQAATEVMAPVHLDASVPEAAPVEAAPVEAAPVEAAPVVMVH